MEIKTGDRCGGYPNKLGSVPKLPAPPTRRHSVAWFGRLHVDAATATSGAGASFPRARSLLHFHLRGGCAGPNGTDAPAPRGCSRATTTSCRAKERFNLLAKVNFERTVRSCESRAIAAHGRSVLWTLRGPPSAPLRNSRSRQISRVFAIVTSPDKPVPAWGELNSKAASATSTLPFFANPVLAPSSFLEDV
jgi:hypothetical protein